MEIILARLKYISNDIEILNVWILKMFKPMQDLNHFLATWTAGTFTTMSQGGLLQKLKRNTISMERFWGKRINFVRQKSRIFTYSIYRTKLKIFMFSYFYMEYFFLWMRIIDYQCWKKIDFEIILWKKWGDSRNYEYIILKTVRCKPEFNEKT